MGGILSPDGESVLHESKWVEAILSPDESMYYYEGEWYSLNEGITSAIPVVIKPPPKRPEYKVEDIRGNDGDASSGKILATIAGLFLLWLIFDSGNILSYGDLARIDCSVWGEFDSFYDSNTQQECLEVRNEAMAIVCGAGLGIFFCILFIFSSPDGVLRSSPRLNAEEKAATHRQGIAATAWHEQNIEYWKDRKASEDDRLWAYTKSVASKRPQMKRCKYWGPDKKGERVRCSNSFTGEGDYCETHSLSLEKP